MSAGGASDNVRPRPSLLPSTGLPTPGPTGRRKSGIMLSPGPISPTKRLSNSNAHTTSRGGNTVNSEIAANMAALQAAIKAKDPANYASPDDQQQEVEIMDNHQSNGIPLDSPKRPRNGGLRRASHADMNGPNRCATPTTPGPPRPPSSLSSSSYASAHPSTSSLRPRISSVTPARRRSDAASLTHGINASMTKTNVNTSTTGSSAALDLGDRVKALGFEGVLRYLGEVQFKEGIWGGIELSGESAGKGKNDGSVQGVQYFACPPNCGIFVQASKIEASMPPPSLPMHPPRPPSSLSTSINSGPTPRKLPRPSGGMVPPSTVTRQATKSSKEASQAVLGRITAGSRASSYLNLTAKDLLERKVAAGRDVKGDEHESESASPTKTGSSMLTNSTASTVAAGVTPRPVRTSRPSVGGTAGTTPGPRKSYGGPGTPTPASMRRPPSSMRSHTPDIPSVPPLPASFAASSQSSATSKQGTSATMATPGRRYSALTSSSSRPTTPSISGRPSSRASNVNVAPRSVSRASSRSSMASSVSGYSSKIGLRPSSRLNDHDDDEVEHLHSSILTTTGSSQQQQTIQDLKDQLTKMTRESEQAKLELLEAINDLRDEQKKVKTLNVEISDLKRSAANSRLDEASAIDEKEELKSTYESQVMKLRGELQKTKQELAEISEKHSSLESGSTLAQTELVQLKSEHEKYVKENKSLSQQLEQLREAGQALVQVYEERLSNAEMVRLETEDQLRSTEEELFKERSEKDALSASVASHLQKSSSLPTNQDDPLNIATGIVSRNNAAHTNTDHDISSTEALLAASLSAGAQTQRRESAVSIDNENLKAELEHTVNRLHKLEEQLDETRYSLEGEVEKEKTKRNEAGAVIESLRKDIAGLNETIHSEKKAKEKLNERIRELETALKESNATLENERAELEVLRSESNNSSSASDWTTKIAQLQAALTVAQGEAAAKDKEITKSKTVIDSLQEELRLMEDLREDEGQTNELASMKAKYETDLALKAKEIEELHQRLQSMPSVQSEPTNMDDQSQAPNTSHTGQIPTATPTRVATNINGSPSLSPSSLSSHIKQMRQKRDSQNSTSSSTVNIANKAVDPAEDEVTKRHETEGLKFLVNQLTGERSDLIEQNRKLIEEAELLKRAQSELEKTVEGLMEQMDAQGPSQSIKSTVTGSEKPSATSEEEVSSLRKKLSRYEKEVQALNQEVMELESLIETKIFREDELECKLRDANLALEKALSGSRGTKETIKATEVNGSKHRVASRAGSRSDAGSDAESHSGDCELCGDPHEIEACPIFGDGSTSVPQQSKRVINDDSTSDKPYCDDCDTYGHSLNDCPVAYEVF